MFIHNRIDVSQVNGPGKRAVIWVQGCELGCAGCWNPESHNPNAGSEIIGQELVDWVEPSTCQHRIEGVTFSGGEPMHQIYALNVVVEEIKNRMSWLSIGMYSGYSEAELEKARFEIYVPQDGGTSSSPIWHRRISSITSGNGCGGSLDFAVLGRYNRLQPVSRPLVTSANQELKLYSRRYDERDFRPQEIEIHIPESGHLVTITGFPTA
jgi:anaerobic ribonucleoside-triphosphate reductase activating protein